MLDANIKVDISKGHPTDELKRLTFIIFQDESIVVDKETSTDDDRKALASWFLELCRAVTSQPELVLDIFDLPRQGVRR